MDVPTASLTRDWTLEDIAFVQRSYVRAWVDQWQPHLPEVMVELQRQSAKNISLGLDLELRGLSLEPADMRPLEVEDNSQPHTTLYELRWHPDTDAVRLVGGGGWHGERATWKHIGEPLRLPGPAPRPSFDDATDPVPLGARSLLADLIGWDPVQRVWLYEVA
jgi:hypothetical protein